LLIASIYLSVRYLRNLKTTPREEPLAGEVDNISDDVSNWKTYVDDTYGYSVKYPPLLVPREGKTGVYLRFVVFLATKGSGESGFAVSVRETELDEEVVFIKEEIQKDAKGKLIREDKIVRDGYSGIRLEYEPEKAEDAEPRVVAVLNNGRYSYTISARPEQIDKILSTFELTK
jgi:hypothetical protein